MEIALRIVLLTVPRHIMHNFATNNFRIGTAKYWKTTKVKAVEKDLEFPQKNTKGNQL